MGISLVNLYVDTHYWGSKGCKETSGRRGLANFPCGPSSATGEGIGHFARWRRFTATTTILFVFPFIFKFCNPSDVKITKDLICTRKQNPEGFWLL